MGSLLSCFSTKKEITGDTKDQKIHKKPRQYDDIDLENDQKIQKKPRQYDEVDLVNDPENNQKENESAKVEPALNYVEVEIKPSSSATTNIVGSDEPKTQYSTIDIAATEKRKLSTQNAEET